MSDKLIDRVEKIGHKGQFDKSMNDYVAIYNAQLQHGDIQIAYELIIKYMMRLKSHYEKTFSEKYSCGNVLPGYMDYTYFYFSDEYFRSKKLRFALVFNHHKMQFELWLMGQSAEVQAKYWVLLKNTKWNIGRTDKPRYSELEAVLLENPDFDDLDSLTKSIEEASLHLTSEITDYLKTLD